MPRSAKLDVQRLVGVTEVAEMAGVTCSAVSNWVARHETFPEPVLRLANGPIFYKPEIELWLRSTGRLL